MAEPITPLPRSVRSQPVAAIEQWPFEDARQRAGKAASSDWDRYLDSVVFMW